MHPWLILLLSTVLWLRVSAQMRGSGPDQSTKVQTTTFCPMLTFRNTIMMSCSNWIFSPSLHAQIIIFNTNLKFISGKKYQQSWKDYVSRSEHVIDNPREFNSLHNITPYRCQALGITVFLIKHEIFTFDKFLLKVIMSFQVYSLLNENFVSKVPTEIYIFLIFKIIRYENNVLFCAAFCLSN